MLAESVILAAIAKARAVAATMPEKGGSFVLSIGHADKPTAPATTIEIATGPNLTAAARSQTVERQVRAALGKGS